PRDARQPDALRPDAPHPEGRAGPVSSGSEPSYAALTREDPNQLKRAVQGRRLADALRLAHGLTPRLIVDYGGGDGALARSAAALWPRARVICFEPAPRLAA